MRSDCILQVASSSVDVNMLCFDTLEGSFDFIAAGVSSLKEGEEQNKVWLIIGRNSDL